MVWYFKCFRPNIFLMKQHGHGQLSITCNAWASPVFSMQEEWWNMSQSVRAIFQHINKSVVIVNVVVHNDGSNCSSLLHNYCLWEKRAVTEHTNCIIHDFTSHNGQNGLTNTHQWLESSAAKSICKLECGQMPNVMAALPNIGGGLCSTPQSLADAHY